jgi:hypothetical protein
VHKAVVLLIASMAFLIVAASPAGAWDSDGWSFGPYTYSQQSSDQPGNPTTGNHDCIFGPSTLYSYKSYMKVTESHSQANCAGYRSDPDYVATIRCSGTVYGVGSGVQWNVQTTTYGTSASCNVPYYTQGTVLNVRASG